MEGPPQFSVHALNTPFVVGDAATGELRGEQWGNAFVAKPATPADELPKFPYLEPPTLHKVPYNGLEQLEPVSEQGG